jgi:PPP family 3-phenylpropionic acid transporter
MEDSKRLGKKLTIDYSLIQITSVMGYCCIFSFASVYLLSRGFTNSQVGLTLTIASGLSILFQPVVAVFADKSKKLALRSIVAILLAISTVFSLLLLAVPALVLPVAILYVLLVAFFGSQVSLVTSMAMEHINNGIPINFSLARGIGSFAFATLSFILGFLVDRFGAWVVMAVNIGLGIIGILLVLTFQQAKREDKNTSVEAKKAAGFIEFFAKNKRFMAIIACVALIYFSHTLINTYTIQIIKAVGGSNSDMGIATAIAGFLELPAMALFPLIYKKMRNAGTIMKIAGGFFIVKTFVTLAAPSVFWIDVAQCIQFFAYAMFVPASVFYVNQVIGDADKVKGQSYMGMAMILSGLIGNFAGGLMLDTSGGVRFMLTVGAAVSTAGLLLLILIDRSHPLSGITHKIRDIREKQAIEIVR